MTSTRRARYLLKKRKHKSPSSVTSYLSNCNMTDSSLEEIPEELVCTNCLESDYYLAQFCEELFCSPSTAIYHLEGLIKNPEFPKGALDKSILSAVAAVPVTTTLCVDCSTSECDEPKKSKICVVSDSSPKKQPEAEAIMPSVESRNSQSSSPVAVSYNYEKERREVERQLIRQIYELVADEPSRLEAAASGQQSSPAVDGGGISQGPHNRVTKLHVSELAIQRMENIQKINYISQIERIKRKLLQSYLAFAKLDSYLLQMGGAKEVNKVVPYSQKIRELERSLHIK